MEGVGLSIFLTCNERFRALWLPYNWVWRSNNTLCEDSMCIPFLILKVRCSGELLCFRVLLHWGVIIGRVRANPTLVHSMSSFVCTVWWYGGMHICHGWYSWLSQSLLLDSVTANTWPIPSPSMNKYVQPWDHTWETLTEGEGGWLLRLGTKEPQHCAIYALLPHSLSPHSALHPPSSNEFKYSRTLLAQSNPAPNAPSILSNAGSGLALMA